MFNQNIFSISSVDRSIYTLYRGTYIYRSVGI